ncbi:MAG: chemotaxis protein CheW [Gemmatimonadaceae bacterium]
MKKKRKPEERTGRRRTPKAREVAPAAPPEVTPPAAPLEPVPAAVLPFAPPPVLELDDASTPQRRLLRDLVVTRGGGSDTLVFRVGPECFAIDLAAVEEAIELPSVHHLPEMPDHLLGVFELRGRLVPVYSPERVLRVALTSEAAAVLVLRAGDKRLGLAVDDIDDVLTIEAASVRRAPVPDNDDNVLLGVIRRGGDLLSLVDAESLALACLADHLTEAA